MKCEAKSVGNPIYNTSRKLPSLLTWKRQYWDGKPKLSCVPLEGTIVQENIIGHSFHIFHRTFTKRKQARESVGDKLGYLTTPLLKLLLSEFLGVLDGESWWQAVSSTEVMKPFAFLFPLGQELEQELAEQKSLLRSVASRGEEILTQHTTAEPSGEEG